MNYDHLVDYGIHQDKSDVHIHVSPLRVYVFPTIRGIEAIQRCGDEYKRQAKQNGETTSQGYAMPISKIWNLRAIEIPDHILDKYPFKPDFDTSAKGRNAVNIVKDMLAERQITFKFKCEEVVDPERQLDGIDLVLENKINIQVKADLRAEETSNIYLEVAERNPNKAH
jgi:hypothetical protein